LSDFGLFLAKFSTFWVFFRQKVSENFGEFEFFTDFAVFHKRLKTAVIPVARDPKIANFDRFSIKKE
jgi:hypothetical protein